MSHDYHEQLPGFSPHQIFVDGCGECEERGQRDDRGIMALDPQSYQRAVDRAAAWESVGLDDVSDAELPLLRVLTSVRYQRLTAGVNA